MGRTDGSSPSLQCIAPSMIGNVDRHRRAINWRRCHHLMLAGLIVVALAYAFLQELKN